MTAIEINYRGKSYIGLSLLDTIQQMALYRVGDCRIVTAGPSRGGFRNGGEDHNNDHRGPNRLYICLLQVDRQKVIMTVYLASFLFDLFAVEILVKRGLDRSIQQLDVLWDLFNRYMAMDRSAWRF